MNKLISLLLVGSVILGSLSRPAAAEVRIETGFTGGLVFLAGQQGDDGAFGSGDKRFRDTAAALLAFLSAGEVADVGRYGLTVRRAAEFLLAASPSEVGYGALDDSGLRGHAIVTMALIEAFTVEPDAQQRQRLRTAIVSAVSTLSRAQVDGAWMTSTTSTVDADSTAWALLALSAADRIGLPIDQQMLQRAKQHITQTTTSASVNAAAPKYIVAARALRLPTTRPLIPAQLAYDDGFFLNFAALDATGLRQRDVRLLGVQQSDGGWPSESARGESRVYTTALSVLALTASMEHLKTLQTLGSVRNLPILAP